MLHYLWYFFSCGFFSEFFFIFSFLWLKIICWDVFFWHLSCFVFSKLLWSVFWCLTVIFGNAQWSLHILLLFLSSPCTPITCLLYLLQFSHSSWIFCYVFFYPFSLFFSVYHFENSYFYILKFRDSLFSYIYTLLTRSKTFLISLSVLISRICFFLRMFISLLILSIFSCMLFIFSFKSP